jgi:hypothetical protein
MSMTELRLPKLPDRTPVRITISVSPDLHQALTDYASIYQEAYGSSEPIQELIPAMLSNFIESDRGFTRRRSRGS